MDFNAAFMALVGNEGALSMDPHDRGNWTTGIVNSGTLKGTKYGISAAAYPGIDIEHLTLEDAKAIYLRDYWRPAGCDLVPDSLKFDLFDMAVNSGVSRAARMLQFAVGVPTDGAIGAQTMAAIQATDAAALDRKFNGARLHFLTTISDDEWRSQGKGLVNRVANNLLRGAA